MGVGAIAPFSDTELRSACLCQYFSFYTKYPQCLGGASRCEILCFEGGWDMRLKKPVTVVKNESTCCCLDYRCALPTDGDVQMACALLGIFCIKPGACSKYGVRWYNLFCIIGFVIWEYSAYDQLWAKLPPYVFLSGNWIDWYRIILANFLNINRCSSFKAAVETSAPTLVPPFGW